MSGAAGCRQWAVDATVPSNLSESYTYDAMNNLLIKTDRHEKTRTTPGEDLALARTCQKELELKVDSWS